MSLQDHRQRLIDQKNVLVRRLGKIDAHLDAPTSRNWDEAATEREDDEVLEALGADGLKELRAIDQAIARLDDGTYGQCLNCGAEILEARLEAVPTATLCRHCAAALER